MVQEWCLVHVPETSFSTCQPRPNLLQSLQCTCFLAGGLYSSIFNYIFNTMQFNFLVGVALVRRRMFPLFVPAVY